VKQNRNGTLLFRKTLDLVLSLDVAEIMQREGVVLMLLTQGCSTTRKKRRRSSPALRKKVAGW
jgi:hypothetical protein